MYKLNTDNQTTQLVAKSCGLQLASREIRTRTIHGKRKTKKRAFNPLDRYHLETAFPRKLEIENV